MNSESQAEATRHRMVLGGLSLVFVVLAVIFVIMPGGSGIPVAEAVQVSSEDLSTSARFSMIGDDAKTEIEGFQRNCMDCHEIIDSQPRSEDLMQHQNIQMSHGLNGRCVNCHDPKNRDKLVSREGEHISFANSAQLCAQCHGTTYRQWERGVHGKTIGYWDTSKGDAKKLSCVECHDPHSPRFAPMAPLPAPNTLRMGPQPGEVHHAEGDKISPLSRGYDQHRRNQGNSQTPAH